MMTTTRFLPLILLFCSPILASCSTITDGSTQQITFKTVGADNANCDVQLGTNDYRYNVQPPQTIWVQKSRKPIFVSCTAPGNRVANARAESTVAASTSLNILNAGLGTLVDGESGALYKYPDEIVIDFVDVAAKDRPLPSYHNVGALDPTAQGIEYLGPDHPALDGDKEQAERYRKAYDEAAQLEAQEAAMEKERQRRIDSLEGGFNGDKGYVAPKAEKPSNQQGVNSSSYQTHPSSAPLFQSSTSF